MTPARRPFASLCLNCLGLLCLLLAGVFTLAAMAENMNLSRLCYVVAVFIALGIAGVFMDTADDMTRRAKERALAGPRVG